MQGVAKLLLNLTTHPWLFVHTLRPAWLDFEEASTEVTYIPHPNSLPAEEEYVT